MATGWVMKDVAMASGRAESSDGLYGIEHGFALNQGSKNRPRRPTGRRLGARREVAALINGQIVKLGGRAPRRRKSAD